MTGIIIHIYAKLNGNLEGTNELYVHGREEENHRGSIKELT